MASGSKKRSAPKAASAAPAISASERLRLFRERGDLICQQSEPEATPAVSTSDHIDFVQLLCDRLKGLRQSLSDAKKDLARFQRNRQAYPWPDGGPRCFAAPFEMLSLRVGKAELPKLMKRPRAAGFAFVRHGLFHYYNQTEIPRIAAALVHAVDAFCFEGKSKILCQLRAARARLPKLSIRDSLLIEFWYAAVTPLIYRAFPEYFTAIQEDEWRPWHLWIGVSEKLVELASNAGDWTQPLNKCDLKSALGHYHRGWSTWLEMHASALRPVGGGTLKYAKQIRVNLASPLLPTVFRDAVQEILIRRANIAAKEVKSLRKSARSV